MRSRSAFLVALFISLAVRPAAGQSESVRAAMQPFVDSGDVSGLVTFIGNKDGVLDVQVLGLADLEHKRPMRRDTIFCIASMTKPITALAVMQLVEEGKIHVEDPVEKYLPNSDGSAMRKALHDAAALVPSP